MTVKERTFPKTKVHLRLNLSYFTLVFGLLFLWGCHNKQKKITFPSSTKTLSGKQVEKINFYSGGNVYLTVADTFLIVQKREEKNIHIYSTNSHDLLASFGKVGKGPGEFLGPNLLKQVGYDSTNNSPVAYIFDFKKQTFSKINILKALNEQNITIEKLLPINRSLPFLHYKGEKFFIGSPGGRGRFIIYNYDTEKVTVVPYLPKPNFNIAPLLLSNVYRSAVVVNKEKGIMAAAPLYLPELDFFDLNGNYLRSSFWANRDNFKNELTGGLGALKNIKYQIVDMTEKGGLIYALNYNNSVTRFYTGNLKNDMKVQVFNWDGKAVKQYYLKDRRITYFAVDLKHRRIYGYCPDEKKHPIIIYEI